MAQKNLEIDMIINQVIGILNRYVDAVSRDIPETTFNTKLKTDFLTNKAAFAFLLVKAFLSDPNGPPPGIVVGRAKQLCLIGSKQLAHSFAS